MLGRVVQRFLSNLFAADPSVPGSLFPHVVFPQLSEVARDIIGHQVDKEEVHIVLMSMKYFTAPGTDEFQPSFYKKYKDHVGDDI